MELASANYGKYFSLFILKHGAKLFEEFEWII